MEYWGANSPPAISPFQSCCIPPSRPSPGFGFGDNHHATVLDDMFGRYAAVYIRHEFPVASVLPDSPVELTIDYDDGFIAYLNGKEVARRGMPAGAATYQTPASISHEAVVALACHLDFNNCTFQKLPNDGPNAEGDALAIIADDANHPGEAPATDIDGTPRPSVRAADMGAYEYRP